MSSMKDYILDLVRPLVDRPDDIRLTDLDGEKTVVVELRCHQGDIGKIIGKSGKTISAVRTLAATVAARNGRRAVVEVVE